VGDLLNPVSELGGPWAHFGRFLIIFGRFGADPKNMFFSIGAKIDKIDE
jgi:hypothetical protein